jgi:large conductance mechanosensitive channel
MNHLKDRTAAKRKAGVPDADEPENEVTLLSEIRDLLAAREGERVAIGSGTDPVAAGSTRDTRAE